MKAVRPAQIIPHYLTPLHALFLPFTPHIIHVLQEFGEANNYSSISTTSEI